MNFVYKKKLKPIILSKKDLVTIADVAYSIWDNELQTALKEWEEKKLPEIRESVSKHNKLLAESNPAMPRYGVFGTLLPISIEDEKQILDKEKDFFLYTTKRLYKFTADFTFNFRDGKSIRSTNPKDLDIENINDEVESIKFKVSNTKGDSVELVLRCSLFGNRIVEVEGEDDTWTRGIKDKIFELLESREKTSIFYAEEFKTSVALVSSFFIGYSLNLAYSYAELGRALGYQTKYILLFVAFIYFFIVSLRLVDRFFPACRVDVSNVENKWYKDSFAGAIAIGLLINGLYRLAEQIYSSLNQA